MAGRNSQVSRIYTILNLLEGAPHGLTVAELVERTQDRGHKAGKRTIYRDLEALGQAGFPLRTVDGEEKASARWVLEQTAKVSQYLVLSCRELFALYLARGMLVPLKETAFFQDLERAFARIEEKLGKRNLEYFQSLGAEVCFEPSPRFGVGLDPDLVETVRTACAEGHVLQVRYTSANAGGLERLRKLGPHYLYLARGSVYLVAEDLEDCTVKVFSLPRMKAAEMMEQAYAGPMVNPEELFKDSIGVFRGGNGEEAQLVRLEFQPEAAQYVRERRWHASQRVVGLEGGRVELALEVVVTPELMQWVLGFGARVLVVEPGELRERVREMAEATARLYGGSRAA